MDEVKSVLFISYDGMTDPLGQSQVLPYLTGLIQLGYSIRLISCEKPERFATHKETIEKICLEAGIEWHPIGYTKNPPLLSTIYDTIKIKRKAKELYKKKPYDLVHCRSYIAALIGVNLKKKFGLKMLFDMRGFWADERVDGNIWNLSNPIYKLTYSFFKQKERQFLIESDHIISLTENGKNEILNWNIPSVEASKITVIPCCVNLALFDPTTINLEQQNEKRKALGIATDNYIVGYVGSIGTWYLLPEMLAYFKVLKKIKPNAKFLFVTGDTPQSILTVAHVQKILPNDLIITSCLHQEVPLHISLFHESVFFIRPSYSKKASSPTKQGEIMAMGIPLICNAGVGDTDSIVRAHQAGKVLEKLDIDTYYTSASQGISFNKEQTQQGAKQVYALDKGVEKYAKVYHSILQ